MVSRSEEERARQRSACVGVPGLRVCERRRREQDQQRFHLKTGTYYYGDFWEVEITSNTAFLWAGTSATVDFPAINATGGPGPRSYASYWMDTYGDMFFYGGATSSGTSSRPPFVCYFI
jgi:hypothetical protein